MQGQLGTEGSIFAIKTDLSAAANEINFVEREQFIGLLLDTEQFLLPMAAVSEIMMLPYITYLPQAPKFIEGVINLRGTILPAINLRKMLGLKRSAPSAACRIIICRHEDISFGVLVDGITSVEALLPDQIEENSMTSQVLGLEMLGRLSKKGEKVRGIFDVVKLVDAVAGDRVNPAAKEA